MYGISPFALVKMSLSNLTLNWMRSSLTIVGMVFGTGAVIATLSSNEGAKAAISRDLSKLGTNIVNVKPPGSSTFNKNDVTYLGNYTDYLKTISLVYRLNKFEFRHSH